MYDQLYEFLPSFFRHLHMSLASAFENRRLGLCCIPGAALPLEGCHPLFCRLNGIWWFSDVCRIYVITFHVLLKYCAHLELVSVQFWHYQEVDDRHSSTDLDVLDIPCECKTNTSMEICEPEPWDEDEEDDSKFLSETLSSSAAKSSSSSSLEVLSLESVSEESMCALRWVRTYCESSSVLTSSSQVGFQMSGLSPFLCRFLQWDKSLSMSAHWNLDGSAHLNPNG